VLLAYSLAMTQPSDRPRARRQTSPYYKCYYYQPADYNIKARMQTTNYVTNITSS